MRRKLAILALCLLLAGWFTAAFVTPWPSVLVIRTFFDHQSAKTSAALAPAVPTGVAALEGLPYDPSDPTALLDIHRGAHFAPGGPTIVWFHGGGFVSGRRGDVANYLKLLAGHGFTVVNVGYAIAPGARYPGPVRQANRALAYLTANGARLRIDANHLVLAGDSAGAQIAAQTAAMITNPAYADALHIAPGAQPDQLAGTLLYCGAYDFGAMGRSGGVVGWFVHAAGWAYSGDRDWRDAGRLATMTIVPHLTSAFPPGFISAGNADPLESQSRDLAQALRQHGVAATTLFFERDHAPPLGHEYQFDLSGPDGRRALDESVAWLQSLEPRARH